MTNKSIRDYITLIENAQQAAEGQMPKTWHDVDPKLGKQVDRMSQAEKVRKGLAHPDTLKKKGVSEGTATAWEVNFDHWDYGSRESKTIKILARSEEDAINRVEKAAQNRGRSILINWARPAEEQLEETIPDAVAKVEQLFRHK